jgi:hypothetical protein
MMAWDNNWNNNNGWWNRGNFKKVVVIRTVNRCDCGCDGFSHSNKVFFRNNQDGNWNGNWGGGSNWGGGNNW